jgi:DNA invertase Pin-like site-specific DNA recombinase
VTKRTAIYARVSVARDEDEDSDSLARQIRACRAFLETKDPTWIQRMAGC